MVNIEIRRCTDDDCDKIIHVMKQPQADNIHLVAYAIKQKERHIFFTGIPLSVLNYAVFAGQAATYLIRL